MLQALRFPPGPHLPPSPGLAVWAPFRFARRTITRSLVALGLTETDWSYFYRLFNEPRTGYEALTGCFLSAALAHMAATEPYVAVVDGVQIPRYFHKMPGTSWLKSPCTPVAPGEALRAVVVANQVN
jgi:hypothetical protein